MLFPHEKRGGNAMTALGISPNFDGTLCHDHWNPSYKDDCQHALCNAYHLRELTCAFEQYEQQWAQGMQELLKEINLKTIEAGGDLCAEQQAAYRLKYRQIISAANEECPPPKNK